MSTTTDDKFKNNDTSKPLPEPAQTFPISTEKHTRSNEAQEPLLIKVQPNSLRDRQFSQTMNGAEVIRVWWPDDPNYLKVKEKIEKLSQPQENEDVSDDDSTPK